MDTESIQSDVPGFYYSERDVERWRHKTLFVMKSEMLLNTKPPPILTSIFPVPLH